MNRVSAMYVDIVWPLSNTANKNWLVAEYKHTASCYWSDLFFLLLLWLLLSYSDYISIFLCHNVSFICGREIGNISYIKYLKTIKYLKAQHYYVRVNSVSSAIK